MIVPARFPSRTVPGLLAHTAARVADRVFLRFVDPAAPTAPPRELTFRAFRDGAARAAAFLAARGVGPGDRVLLLAENSPEWAMIALGAQALRAEPVALFASLSAAAVQDIVPRVRPRIAIVSSAEQWTKLAPAIDERVNVADVAASTTPALPDFDARCRAVGEEDPFLLLFTSGSTGRSKGVRLPQRTIVHAIDAGAPATDARETDVGLHFLPFGHVAGHDQFVLALAQGHQLIMVARRDDVPRGLALGPTYLFSVPHLYDRVREGALARVAALPRPARALVEAALAAGARVRVDGSRRIRDRALVPLADRLVGRKVRAGLGGRVRGLFAGGAPASPALFRFFEGLGLPLVELYGMSETAGMIASNLFAGARVPGVAGWVSPDHEVRLADDGELLVRGPLLMSGYLDEEPDSFTADGFFRTGDLASFDAAGRLRIEGRKKHLLVLSTGKKLSPEPIEQAIAAARPFEGAVLAGEGRPYVTAAVFVAREELARLAAAGKDAARELLPRARAALHAFSEFEKPKQLVVIEGAPHEHPSFITPTLKVRRQAVLDAFAARFARLYSVT